MHANEGRKSRGKIAIHLISGENGALNAGLTASPNTWDTPPKEASAAGTLSKLLRPPSPSCTPGADTTNPLLAAGWLAFLRASSARRSVSRTDSTLSVPGAAGAPLGTSGNALSTLQVGASISAMRGTADAGHPCVWTKRDTGGRIRVKDGVLAAGAAVVDQRRRASRRQEGVDRMRDARQRDADGGQGRRAHRHQPARGRGCWRARRGG